MFSVGFGVLSVCLPQFCVAVENTGGGGGGAVKAPFTNLGLGRSRKSHSQVERGCCCLLFARRTATDANERPSQSRHSVPGLSKPLAS